jgi:hypothetical protein
MSTERDSTPIGSRVDRAHTLVGWLNLMDWHFNLSLIFVHLTPCHPQKYRCVTSHQISTSRHPPDRRHTMLHSMFLESGTMSVYPEDVG